MEILTEITFHLWMSLICLIIFSIITWWIVVIWMNIFNTVKRTRKNKFKTIDPFKGRKNEK